MMRRFLKRRARGDRGLALVEFAIVAPLLAMLVAGIVEYGTLWRDNLTVTSSTRAAARVVSNLGDNHLADFEAVLSLDSGIAAIDGVTIEGVLIFDATAADGQPHSSCFDTNDDPRSSTGYCNFYTSAQVTAMAAIDCSVSCSEFPDNANCVGALSASYCPQTDRETAQIVGLSSVGVWIRVNRAYLTGMFPGDGVTITDQTVMKVEPK